MLRFLLGLLGVATIATLVYLATLPSHAGLGVLILLAGGFAIRFVIARSRDRKFAR